MSRLVNGFATGLLFVAGTMFTIATTSLLIQVVSRYAFNAPRVWSEELAIFSFVWASMLAIPVAFLRREHITIGFAVNALPTLLRHVVSVVTDLISAVTLVVIGFYGTQLLGAAERQSLSGLSMLFNTLIPTSYLYLAIPVGCALSVVMILYRMVNPLHEAGAREETIKTPETEV